MFIKDAQLPHFSYQRSLNGNPDKKEGSLSKIGVDLDLHLNPKQIYLLLGDSGSGKSTLMRCIAGFNELKSGEIELQGKQVAMLLQNPFHQIVMQTAYDELYFPQKNAGVNKEKAEAEILKISKMLDISSLLNRNISTLSFGETQLLMIATTVLTPADIYLFDEPTSHLDPPAIKRFYACLSFLAKKGKTILVSTQNTDEYTFADRILFLENGKLNADYTKDEMRGYVQSGKIKTDVQMIKAKLKGLKK